LTIDSSSIALRKLHIETILDDDLQPFSMRPLLNSRIDHEDLHTDISKEIIVGCASGTLIVFEIKTKPDPFQMISGIKCPTP